MQADMKIDIDELGPIRRKVRVELPPETVAHQFSRAYQTLGRRVRVKGFRAGKIPRNVLQGIYGDEIKGQVRSQLVEDSLSTVIRQRGLQIVSRPEVEANDDLEEGRPFSFSAEFEIKPDLEIKDYLGLQLECSRVSVTPAQVEEALRRLQESHARLEPVADRAVVERGDFVVVDFEGRVGGKAFAGAKGENHVIEIGGGQSLPQFEDALVGMSCGDSGVVAVNYPQDYRNREIAGKMVEFSVIVREIKQKVLPVLDDEFAKDYGECASLDELKSAVATRLEAELKQVQREDLKEQLLHRLLQSHSFPAPPSLVERQSRYLIERYQYQGKLPPASDAEREVTPEETRRNLEARAARQVQATLLVEKIAATEKIEVSDSEVQERVDQLARSAGERAKTLREYYSKPESREELRTQLVFDRTLQFLLEHASIKEVGPEIQKVAEAVEKS